MSLFFTAAVTIHSDFRAQENKACHCFHCFSMYLPWSNGMGCHDLCFLICTYHIKTIPKKTKCKKFVWEGLTNNLENIPVCVSSNWAFLMMYSAYKLSNQGDNIQLWHTPFLIRNQSVVPCSVLIVASWLAYRFLRGQIRWSTIPITKSKIMASHSITSWQIHGETMKTVTSFIFLGSKVTGDSDCSCGKRDSDPWKIKLWKT